MEIGRPNHRSPAFPCSVLVGKAASIALGRRFLYAWQKRRRKTDALISDTVQLHASNMGETHQEPRGPPRGSQGIHRRGGWETARFLVRFWRTRRIQLVGGS